jgi:hypothetical protein
MSRVLQVAGMLAITGGVFWISVPAGLIVAGVFCVLVGVSLAG